MTRATAREMAPRQVRTPIRNVITFFVLCLLSSCGSATEPVRVASVSVTPNTIAKAVPLTQQFVATTLDANGGVLTGRTITWVSDNSGIATVNGTGLVTTVGAGTATITATSEGQSGTATIVVNPPPVVSVAITPVTTSITEIQRVQLTAVTKTADSMTVTNRSVTWSSSTPAAATVDSLGVLTGVAPGSTVITATSEGIAASATITVVFSPCNVNAAVVIVPGQTINGTLSDTDCPLGDGTFLDGYRMVISIPTTIDIVMKSTAFNAYLFLYQQNTTTGVLTTLGEDDDSGGGTDAELSGQINPGTYFIAANNVNVGGFGAYTLSLTSPAAAGINSSVKLERLGTVSAHMLRGNLLRGLRRK